MSKDWPSTLDAKIAAGKADPISDDEKEAVARFNETYHELFGMTDLACTVAAPSPQKLSYYEKLVQALGWDNK